MSEGLNADNTIVDIEERCVVKDKLTRIGTMKVAKLKDELKKRILKTTGKKKELQDRLRAFIALKIEHGEDEEDKERDVFETRVKHSGTWKSQWAHLVAITMSMCKANCYNLRKYVTFVGGLTCSE